MSSDNLLVIAELRNGKLRDQTLECIGRAIEMSEKYNFKVSCVVLGHLIKGVIAELSEYVDTVYFIDDKNFALYNNELYKRQISNVIKEVKPRLVLMGHTSMAMDLMPGLSARLGFPLITDCLDLWFDGDKLMAIRYMYEGRVKAKILLSHSSTYLATLRSGIKPRKRGLKGTLIEISPVIEADVKVRPIELIEPMVEDVDISKSEIVVGIGLGIASKENLHLAERLANVLGGVLGCTRPVVDRGWLPQSRQIGFSGKSIKPKLYLAIGLSGSSHHVKGIEGARKIIAINKDPGAPIFNYSDYGAIGDLFEIVPPLIERLEEMLKQERGKIKS